MKGITEERFGRLQVLSFDSISAGKARLAQTRHGMTHSPKFIVWKGMKARCGNPDDPSYEGYGGRGIKVREPWADSFENFLADMGLRPEGTTLDRIDNEKGYEPGNCRWATKLEQAFNRRTTIQLSLNGAMVSRKEASRRLGISDTNLKRLLKGGMTPDQIARKKDGLSVIDGALVTP